MKLEYSIHRLITKELETFKEHERPIFVIQYAIQDIFGDIEQEGIKLIYKPTEIDEMVNEKRNATHNSELFITFETLDIIT